MGILSRVSGYSDRCVRAPDHRSLGVSPEMVAIITLTAVSGTLMTQWRQLHIVSRASQPARSIRSDQVSVCLCFDYLVATRDHDVADDQAVLAPMVELVHAGQFPAEE